MLEMLKGYMARESLMTPVLNLNPVPSPRGSFGGLSPPIKTPSPPQIEIRNTINQWNFCQFLECQATPHKPKAPAET